MKKKLIMLIIISLLCSGCTAKYNLNIENNKYKEKLTIEGIEKRKKKNINIPINTECNEIEVYEKRMSDVKYYDVKQTIKGLELNYTFNNENFPSSMILNSCYDKVVFSVDDYEILLKTSDSFTCFEQYEDLEKITIKITSKYKLIKTNANKVDNNNYYWYIDKNKKDSANILLRLDVKKYKKDIFDIIDELNLTVPLVLIAIIIISTLIVLLFKGYGNKRNAV